MENIVCVVLARGGSKGIPGKNLVDFCGRPLLAWTVEQALAARHISSVWVSSDSRQILDLAEDLGAGVIERPAAISDDEASSESGWLHALEALEKTGVEVATLVAPQCTSPVREAADFDRAIEIFRHRGLDSLFSAAEVTDFNLWRADSDDRLTSFTYDYRNRGRRQDRDPQYLENGSFYLLRPELLMRAHNRLGGNIGVYRMPLWKSFQIDEPEDIRFCETLMRTYLPDNLPL
jgi:N-acylneuraminate cytidylyltransferase